MSFDWGILQEIQKHLASPFLNGIMPKITMLGNIGSVWLIITVLLICSRKYRKYGVILFIGIAISALDLFILKNVVQRSRPCWLDPGFSLLINSPKDYSFPSGHTLVSALSATILTMTNRKFGLFAIPLALLIAFSRLYLYVHFPTDVLAGAAMGIMIGAVTFMVSMKVLKKREESKSAAEGAK